MIVSCETLLFVIMVLLCTEVVNRRLSQKNGRLKPIHVKLLLLMMVTCLLLLSIFFLFASCRLDNEYASFLAWLENVPQTDPDYGQIQLLKRALVFDQHRSVFNRSKSFQPIFLRPWRTDIRLYFDRAWASRDSSKGSWYLKFF
jgi:hypothetical protein